MPYRPRPDLKKHRAQAKAGRGRQGGLFNAFYCDTHSGEFIREMIVAINNLKPRQWKIAGYEIRLTFSHRDATPRIVVSNGDDYSHVYFPSAPISRAQMTVSAVGSNAMVVIGSSLGPAMALLAKFGARYQRELLPMTA